MYCSPRPQRLRIVAATLLVAMQPMCESVAHKKPPSPGLMDSWEPRPIFNTHEECIPSPLWTRAVDTSKYEFGCKEIEAMLDATAVMVGRGSVREVFRVEYEGRTLVVKRMSSSWEDAPEDQQRRIRRIARREVVALDAATKEFPHDKIVEDVLRHFHTFGRPTYSRGTWYELRKKTLGLRVEVRGNSNVVGMVGVCETDIVSEYLPFKMFEFIRNEEANGSTMSLFQIVGLALGAARGLQALHEAPGGPIVHMDIKREQFLIGGDGVARIDDLNFGWFMGSNASSAEGEDCPFTTGRSAKSQRLTGAFRAPEYIACQPLTKAVDIFSLAIIFYEMISRTRAICDSECRLTYSDHLVPPGVKFNPEWPIGFAQVGGILQHCLDMIVIMEDMWHENPDRRPSAGEVVSRLEALLELLSD